MKLHPKTQCCNYECSTELPYPVMWNEFNNVVQCHNCGHVYTPFNRDAASNFDKIRKALVGLVGAESKSELEGMEAAIRILPVPDEDRMHTINAIHALRDTSQ